MVTPWESVLEAKGKAACPPPFTANLVLRDVRIFRVLETSETDLGVTKQEGPRGFEVCRWDQ